MQYISLSKNDEELSKILGLKPYAIKMSRQNIAKNGIKYYINLYDKYVFTKRYKKNNKIETFKHLNNNLLVSLISNNSLKFFELDS